MGRTAPTPIWRPATLPSRPWAGRWACRGTPTEPRCASPVPQVWFHTAAEAMVGALTAHARMLVTGEAQFVDVSAQASMVWAMLHARVAHAVQGADLNRSGSVLQLGTLTMPLVHECADGFIVVAPFGATLTKLVPLMVADGTVPEEWIESEDWPIYERNLLQQNPVRYQMDEVLGAMGSFLRGRTKSELLDLGLRNSVTIAPVSTTEDLARFRQLEERGYWLTAPLPNGSETKVPSVLGRPAETPMSVRQWAPTLGQHNSDILGGELGLSDDETAAASGRGA